jgi:hypothetical protein
MDNRRPRLNAFIDISEAMSIYIEEVAKLAAEEAVAQFAERMKVNKPEEDKLLTLDEAAARCKCSKQTLAKYRRQGLLKTTMVGGISPHILTSELKRFLAE